MSTYDKGLALRKQVLQGAAENPAETHEAS